MSNEYWMITKCQRWRNTLVPFTKLYTHFFFWAGSVGTSLAFPGVPFPHRLRRFLAGLFQIFFAFFRTLLVLPFRQLFLFSFFSCFFVHFLLSPFNSIRSNSFFIVWTFFLNIFSFFLLIFPKFVFGSWNCNFAFLGVEVTFKRYPCKLFCNAPKGTQHNATGASWSWASYDAYLPHLTIKTLEVGGCMVGWNRWRWWRRGGRVDVDRRGTKRKSQLGVPKA